MSSENAFTRFVTLVDMNEESAQNVQEMASIWGKIDNELQDIGVTVEDSYAVLGEVDFLIIYEAPSPEEAFQADIILERHGLDVQTMELTPTEHFSELVMDV